MKVIHFVIEDYETAKDFIKSMEGFSSRTESHATDDAIRALLETVAEEFHIER